jgi:L-Ala-D/L-Glu epimerase
MQRNMERIIAIDIKPFSIACRPFVISLGTLYEAPNIMVRIKTASGIVGYGEGSPFPMIASETQASCIAIGKDFANILLDKNALDIADNMQLLHKYIPHAYTTKSTFDMALHDIAAQHYQKPLYHFLGGAVKPLVTDETIVIGSAEEMAERAKILVDKGIAFIKIKLGKGMPQDDINRVKAIRAVTPPHILLRLDANQGWTVTDAIHILQELHDCNVQYCEQPVAYYDVKGLKKVKQESPIKIMADESCFIARDAEELIAQEACDYINIKFAKCGGILEATQIAQIAAKANMPCMLGGMIESRLALTANAHFAMTHNIIQFYDLDLCFPHTENPIEGGVVFENNYTIHVSDSIGIGAKPIIF